MEASHIPETPPWEHVAVRYDSGAQLLNERTIFQRGVRFGQWLADEKVIKQFEKEINFAMGAGARLFRQLAQHELAPNEAFLRVSADGFTILVLMDEQIYYSERGLRAYELAEEVEQQAQEEEVDLSFMFMGLSDSVNREALVADGYKLRYAPTRQGAA